MRKINVLLIITMLLSMAAFASTAFAGSFTPSGTDNAPLKGVFAPDLANAQKDRNANLYHDAYSIGKMANGNVLFYLAPVSKSMKVSAFGSWKESAQNDKHQFNGGVNAGVAGGNGGSNGFNKQNGY